MYRLSSIETANNGNPASLLKVFYKHLILIVLIIVFCGLCGVLYSVYKVKPVYTASRSVILRIAFREEDSTTAAGSVSLAKTFLPTVERAIKSPNALSAANDEYKVEGDTISASAISVSYNSNSLIFKVSYQDVDAKKAKAKLSALISTVAVRLESLIQADNVTLINVQQAENAEDAADITVTSDFNKYVILGFMVGIIISVGIVLIKYLMDNTVKSKSEYEYLTGVSVLAIIDKVDEKDSN